MATEEDSTPENRARRVEKQWRHEERALSSTHAFWEHWSRCTAQLPA